MMALALSPQVCVQTSTNADTKPVYRGKVYSVSCSSTLHRGGHVRNTGLPPFSMQSAPQILYTVWRTREKHWSTSIQHAVSTLHAVWRTREKHCSTSIQHAVSSTNTLRRVEDT